jgi:RimJ/RimL family protein N-acetyltransferase
VRTSIGTERLLVRPWVANDLAAVHAIWGDPDVIFWGACKDLDSSRALMDRVRARCAGKPWPVAWHGVIERATGTMVGDVILQPAPFAPGEIEVGWHLRRDAWGHGYATEAAAALIAEGFACLPNDRLVCAILPENHRSQRVAARLGFVLVGPIVHANLPHNLFDLPRPGQTGL